MARHKSWDASQHPRHPKGSDEGGRFTDRWGGGGGTLSHVNLMDTTVREGLQHMPHESLVQQVPEQEPLFRDGLSPATALKTSDVDYAAKALGQGFYVELDQPRTVSTLLDKLYEITQDAKAKGEEAPKYDLCRVSVPHTNLFCAESKGIPRIKMPQLTGKPIPGSPADYMEKDDKGEVDLAPAFTSFLQNQGYVVEDGQTDAAMLRATQAELDGAKVAKFARIFGEGGYDMSMPVWTTEDDYIIDGHHRWAGMVGGEFRSGETLEIPTKRIRNLDIVTALRLSIKFTSDMGIPPLAFGQFQAAQETK